METDENTTEDETETNETEMTEDETDGTEEGRRLRIKGSVGPRLHQTP